MSTSGLHEGDYLMVGDELNRLRFIPDQPDADSTLRGWRIFAWHTWEHRRMFMQ